MEFLFLESSLWSIENKKPKEFGKECYRPENCPNVVALKVDSEIGNEKLLL